MYAIRSYYEEHLLVDQDTERYQQRVNRKRLDHGETDDQGRRDLARGSRIPCNTLGSTFQAHTLANAGTECCNADRITSYNVCYTKLLRAVRLTADRMNRLRSVSFDHADLTATAGTNDPVDNRAVRAATVGFTVQRIIADIDANHKQVTLRTTWAWQGENFTHSISTVRRRS